MEQPPPTQGASVFIGGSLGVITAGDADGDGFADFVVQTGSGVTFAHNNQNGTFTKSDVAVGGTPRDLDFGDINGDGYLDLVATNDSSSRLAVMLNDQHGDFHPATYFEVSDSNHLRQTILVDLDNDGYLDMVATSSSWFVDVLLNNDNDGTFTKVSTFLNIYAQGLAAGDVNGDGDIDLVFSSFAEFAVGALLSDGSGGFTQGTKVTISPWTGDDVELGDLDGDGDLDLIVNTDTTVAVLLNDGKGVFSIAASAPVDNLNVSSDSISLADFDKDGDLDIGIVAGGTAILFNTMSNYSVSSAVSSNEGGSGTGGELVFTITRTATSEAEDVTFTLGGTALAGTDYVAPVLMEVSFAAGDKTAAIHIAIIGDSEIEAGETVVLTLENPAGEGVISTKAGSGTATIIADDFPPNNAPVIGSANADTTAQAGSLISLTIGDGHFTDPDGNDLDYTITVNGGAKPAWLTFDAETGLLTGAPTTAEAGTYLISVKASDGSATSPADEFSLTITNPIAPQDPKGTKGNDTLVGDSGDNIVDGRKGNDKLTGGDGADTFVFGKGYGRDVILDFDATEGDRIDLSDAVGIRNFNDLIAHHVNDDGPHLKITADDGSVLVIKNFDHAADLAEGMFIF